MHDFIPAADGTPAFTGDPSHAAAIKRWTHETLALEADAVVTVSERPCRDPGCPLLETTITVFEETGTRAWKLTRPHVAVTKMMIRQTLATPPALVQKSNPIKNRSSV